MDVGLWMWDDLVWYGEVWYGMMYCVVVCCVSRVFAIYLDIYCSIGECVLWLRYFLDPRLFTGRLRNRIQG